jgi:hypothetical protein
VPLLPLDVLLDEPTIVLFACRGVAMESDRLSAAGLKVSMVVDMVQPPPGRTAHRQIRWFIENMFSLRFTRRRQFDGRPRRIQCKAFGCLRRDLKVARGFEVEDLSFLSLASSSVPNFLHEGTAASVHTVY